MERDRHHVWHSRAWYTSSLDKKFRNYRGFVIPLDREIHNEIHATITQPPKPSPVLQRGLLDHLGNFNYDYKDTLLHSVDYFNVIAVLDEEHREYLLKIGDNLLRQCNIMFDTDYEAIA